MTRIRSLVLALVLVGAAAACGSSSSSGTPTTGSGSPGPGNTVTIKDFKFTPASLTVKVGTKVTFINEDTTTHTATSQGGSTISSGNLAHGQSYTVTFTKAGTYQYICSIHPYMKGTVTVQ
jgi:plastocyanin